MHRVNIELTYEGRVFELHLQEGGHKQGKTEDRHRGIETQATVVVPRDKPLCACDRSHGGGVIHLDTNDTATAVASIGDIMVAVARVMVDQCCLLHTYGIARRLVVVVVVVVVVIEYFEVFGL